MAEYTTSELVMNYPQIMFLKEFLVGHPGFIAGGCFRAIFTGSKPTDVDNLAILALGIGLPSYERLNSLVESGKVIATEKNGKVYVSWAPGWNAANWMKPEGSNTIFDILSQKSASSGNKTGSKTTTSASAPYRAGGAIFSNKDMVR